ncbi:MAG TPA: metal ABC transporter permease, partial [Negativicutes bacterium]|nr:metal ABC transporter permease [Negativicutes bacterium]
MLDWWYGLVNYILPFQWMGHTFMKNALLAVLLVTPLFGLLGTMVVSNRMAFFSDSLGHGAFTGIAIGALLGGIRPLTALVVFSVLFALSITVIKNRSGVSTDSVIGVFSSTAIALGLMIMSRGGSFTKYSSYLIGDLLSITPTEIGMLWGVFIGIIFL